MVQNEKEHFVRRVAKKKNVQGASGKKIMFGLFSLVNFAKKKIPSEGHQKKKMPNHAPPQMINGRPLSQHYNIPV